MSADPPLTSLAVAFEDLRFLVSLDCPEYGIDLATIWVEAPPVEIAGQSFAYQQLVDFGAPARSRRVMRYRGSSAPRMSGNLNRFFLRNPIQKPNGRWRITNKFHSILRYSLCVRRTYETKTVSIRKQPA